MVWASVVRFVLGTEGEEYIDPELFTDGDKVLAKAIVFHGPFKTFEEAATSAQGLRAVVVLPAHLWTDTDQPFWVASLSN